MPAFMAITDLEFAARRCFWVSASRLEIFILAGCNVGIGGDVVAVASSEKLRGQGAAYWRVHSRAVWMAAASSSFQR